MLNDKCKILLTGGGTAGSVSPLLALIPHLKKDKSDISFLWLGTKNGPERKMVEYYGIPFKPISAGKLRRYFDLRNFLDIFKIILGFKQAFWIIFRFKPDIILSAGSFVSVPVVWAGWVLKKKSIIHQQDVRPGLANKLMAPFATKITVTFEESLKRFPKSKTIWTGNPVRDEILAGDRERAIDKFKLERGVPTLLVMGGGTGSAVINAVVLESLSELVEFCQVVHLTGARNKKQDTRNKQIPNFKIQISNNNNVITSDQLPVTSDQRRYHQTEFLDAREMADAYAVADLVVSRCGMSSMTELSALGKPTIFIPLQDTHQEDNARLVLDKKAGMVIWQKEFKVDKLVKIVKDVLNNKEGALSKNVRDLVKDGGEEIAKLIKDLVTL